jgi:HEAT repeat protein
VLGKIGEPAVLPLIKALVTSLDPRIRIYSIKALGQTRDRRALRHLIDSLYDRSRAVRTYAAIALGKLGDEAAVVPLVQALDDRGYYVPYCAVGAIGKIRSETAVEPLLEALQNPDENVRAFAAEALGELGSEKAVPALNEALNDKRRNVREKATEALGKIASAQAVDPLVQSLQGKGGSEETVKSLASMGKVAVPALIRALKKPSEYNQPLVMDALAAISAESVIPLVDVLEYAGDDAVIVNACSVLGRLGDARAVKGLAGLLEHEAWEVRAAAVIALGSVKDRSAVKPLLEALADDDMDVRNVAVKALAERDREITVPLNKIRMEHEDSSARLAADTVLREIVRRDFDNDMSKWEEWYEKNKDK